MYLYNVAQSNYFWLCFSLTATTGKQLKNEKVTSISSVSYSQLNEDAKEILSADLSSSLNTDMQFEEENYSSAVIHKNNYKMEELTSILDSSRPYEKDYSPERDLEDLLSIVEPCQDVSKASSEVDSGAASDSADTSFAQINLTSLTESELTANKDTSRVSYTF